MKELIHQYGAWIVFALVFLELIGLPLPGEAILVSAAIFAATTRDISVALVLLPAVLGAIFGSIIGFWIGDRHGYPLLLRYGSYIGLTETRIKIAQYLFRRQGNAGCPISLALLYFEEDEAAASARGHRYEADALAHRVSSALPITPDRRRQAGGIYPLSGTLARPRLGATLVPESRLIGEAQIPPVDDGMSAFGAGIERSFKRTVCVSRTTALVTGVVTLRIASGRRSTCSFANVIQMGNPKRPFLRGRGTSAVRSISDIGARVCPTAAVVNVIFGVGHARV